MKLKHALASALVAGYVLPMVAVAEVAPTAHDAHAAAMVLAAADTERFDMLDTNQDGVIDRQEAAADPDVAAAFDEIDTANNGLLTPEEFSAWEEVTEERRY